jgi:hypothetical protein
MPLQLLIFTKAAKLIRGGDNLWILIFWKQLFLLIELYQNAIWQWVSV